MNITLHKKDGGLYYSMCIPKSFYTEVIWCHVCGVLEVMLDEVVS